MRERGERLPHVGDRGVTGVDVEVERLVEDDADVVRNGRSGHRLRSADGEHEGAGRHGVRRLAAGDEQIENRTESEDLRRFRRLARRTVLGREIVAEVRGEGRIAQGGEEAAAELLAGHADLAVVVDPDELRDERPVGEPAVRHLQVGDRGEGEGHLFGDDDGLIDR